jgi:two-component system, sensor histidine kinase and response regulator
MTAAASQPMLDHAEGLRRAGGDAALYRELLGVFLRDVPRLLGLLDAAAAQPSALRHAVHSLKGSASVIGATGIAQQAGILEKLARADPAAEAGEPLRLLRADLSSLAAQLEAETNARSPQEAP